MTNSKLIDTHCHLDMLSPDADVEDLIRRADEAGVEKIITIGSDLNGSEAAVRIANGHDSVFATVGIHPHDAVEFSPEVSERIKSLAGGERVVAIGEIGLDYHYDHSPGEVQRDAFRKQLSLARELDLPVVVHSREAKEDTLRILSESGVERGVMHCFSGDTDMAERTMAMGLYISIAGPVTFKNASGLQDVAAVIPDEYLLIETDAPYLAPVPLRGKRNEPAYMVHTAQKLADLRGVSYEDIARITRLNAGRLFGISETHGEETIAYKIRESLYLNVTNRCTNACTFCVRFHSDYVKGHKLRLEHEPSLEELKSAVGNPQDFREVVFCGYGEPLIRLELVKDLAGWIKGRGGSVRINTNGHANMIHKRDVLPELHGIVDSISVSLDAQDAETYEAVCKPFIKDAFSGVLEFIKEAGKYIPDVTVTVVNAPGVDLERCEHLADELGVNFRLRKLDVVG